IAQAIGIVLALTGNLDDLERNRFAHVRSMAGNRKRAADLVEGSAHRMCELVIEYEFALQIRMQADHRCPPSRVGPQLAACGCAAPKSPIAAVKPSSS